MKKLVFILFVLVLLTTSVYAFSIKDSLTSFSISDFFYNLFHKDVVGKNVKLVETTKVSQDIPISPSSHVNDINDVSNQQNIQQDINQESIEELPVISSEQIQNDIQNIQTQGTNIIVQKQQPQSIIITQGNNLNQAVPVPVLNGYLSVATLKQDYYVNEQINLTDPPTEESNGFFSNLIENIKGIFSKDVKGEEINVKEDVISGEIQTSLLNRPKPELKMTPKGPVYVNPKMEYINGTLNYSKSSDMPLYVPKRLIVKFKNEINENPTDTGILSIDNLNKNYKAVSLKKISKHEKLKKVYGINFQDEIDVFKTAEEYKKDPNVVYAEPSFIAYTNVIPNDPYYETNQFWALTSISAPEGWDISTGSSDVSIAIIDTGVDSNHEDLNGKVLLGYDFVNLEEFGLQYLCDPNEDCTVEDNDPMDFYGHGTHCSGIAAAHTNNDIGIAGVCWGCMILPVRAGWATSYGGGALLIEDIVQGIYYAIDQDVDVISMSFGGPYDSQLEHNAIIDAYNNNINLVAAAGNSWMQTLNYPGAYEEVIGVIASVTGGIGKAYFSSYGYWYDISAPGSGIYSTIPNNQYEYMSGTSMATPHVAGVIGLIKSVYEDYTPQQVKNTLYQSTTDMENVGADPLSGEGLINISHTLSNLNDPNFYINAIISSPTYFEIKNKHDGINIEGIIDTSYGLNNFVLRTAYGTDPEENEFSEQSISLNQNIVEGPQIQYLGFWDSSYLTKTGPYTISLIVYDNLSNIKEYRSVIYIDVNLRSGFPINIPIGYTGSWILSVMYTPTIYDINGDGKDEIVVSKPYNTESLFDGEGDLYVYDENGNLLPGWPYHFLTATQNGAVVGDILPSLEGKEIVVTDYIDNIYVFSINGELISQYNVYFEDDLDFYGATQIEDLNNDEKYEILNIGRNYTLNPYIKCYLTSITMDEINNNGEIESNFSINWVSEIDFGGYDLCSSLRKTFADLDGDGKLEVFVYYLSLNYEGYYHFINIFDDNGSLIYENNPTLPASDLWSYSIYPVAGDVDSDYKDEIVLQLSYTEGALAVYDFDNENNNLIIKEGWPKIFPQYGEDWNQLLGQTLLGKVDSNGLPKIFQTSYVNGLEFYDEIDQYHLFNDDGSYYSSDWPSEYEENLGDWIRPEYADGAIFDMNNDLNQDFLILTQEENITNWYNYYCYSTPWYCFYIRILNMNGVLYSDYKLMQRYFSPSHSGPMVANLDNNNHPDIVSYSVGGDYDTLYAWELPTIVGDIEWKQPGYNEKHTFRYESGGVQPPQYILTANQTYGISPLSILFSINGDFIQGTQFIWYFGDITQTTNSPSIVHVYQNEGNYNVRVRIIPPNMNPIFTNIVNIIVLPKSKIQNTGPYMIQGYLLMKIQKNVNGMWQDYQTVVNDLSTGIIRTIQGNSYLALDLIWNPYNVMINQAGDYRVYAALLNGNGQVIQTMQGSLEDTYEFIVTPIVIPINKKME